jgi:hypothetical protein
MTGAIVDGAKFIAVCVICYAATATLRVTDRARGGHSCSSTGFARSTAHTAGRCSPARACTEDCTCVGKLSQRGVLPLARASSR